MLTPRFVTASALGTVAALLALGLPTAIIANPFFASMTPTEPVNFVVWLASAPLMGVLLATYLPRAGGRAGTRHNFVNTDDTPLRLITIYAPPEHAPGTVHQTKAEADAAEH